MMSKVFLNTIDKEKEFDFKRAEFMTNEYNRLLLKKEIHLNIASKIILKNNSEETILILSRAIIDVRENGNIHILTSATYDQVMGVNEYFVDENLKTTKKRMKMLQQQLDLGMSINEFIELFDLEEKYYISKLLEKNDKYILGGGL